MNINRQTLLHQFLIESDVVHPQESSGLTCDEAGDRWNCNPAWHLLKLAYAMDPGEGVPSIPNVEQIKTRAEDDKAGNIEAGNYLKWMDLKRHDARMTAVTMWLHQKAGENIKF